MMINKKHSHEISLVIQVNSNVQLFSFDSLLISSVCRFEMKYSIGTLSMFGTFMHEYVMK